MIKKSKKPESDPDDDLELADAHNSEPVLSSSRSGSTVVVSKGNEKSHEKSNEEMLRDISTMVKELYRLEKKASRRTRWLVFFGFLRMLFIFIPLVLALIYLPPLVNDLLEQYQTIIGVGSVGPLSDALSNGSGLDVNDILSNISTEQLQALFNTFQR